MKLSAMMSSCFVHVKACWRGDTVESKPSEITPEFLNTPNRSAPELLLQVNVTFSLTVVQHTCRVAKNISVENKILISTALAVERS